MTTTRAMSTINISLPEPMKAYIDEQVVKGCYGTVSEYFRALVRAEQKRRAQEELEEKLLAGLNSGPPIEVDTKFWQQKRADLLERHAKGKKK